jgi:hypothetical protein
MRDTEGQNRVSVGYSSREMRTFEVFKVCFSSQPTGRVAVVERLL